MAAVRLKHVPLLSNYLGIRNMSLEHMMLNYGIVIIHLRVRRGNPAVIVRL